MKRIKSVLLIIVVVLGMCSCVKKHDASDIIKTNKLSTNNSTSIEDKKVEIEGIFIKNSPLAQWNIFRSNGKEYGIGTIPKKLESILVDSMENGSTVKVNGIIKNNEIGPGDTIYPQEITVIKNGESIEINEPMKGIFNDKGNFVNNGIEYKIAISKDARPKEYESLMMNAIKTKNEEKIYGKMILNKTTIIITDME
jgi:hypothetical protein